MEDPEKYSPRGSDVAASRITRERISGCPSDELGPYSTTSTEAVPTAAPAETLRT